MYRFARAARIYDGPDEVHRQTVARRILNGYSPPPGEVPIEHLPTRREQSRERFAHLLGALTRQRLTGEGYAAGAVTAQLARPPFSRYCWW